MENGITGRTMMLKAILFVVVVAVIAVGPAWSADDRPENTDTQVLRIVSILTPELVSATANAVARISMMGQEDKRQQYEDLLLKNLDAPAIENILKRAYQRHFDTKELKEMADFFDSPSGKIVAKKLAAFEVEVQPLIRAQAIQAMGVTHRELK
jgi:hypothetical protein